MSTHARKSLLCTSAHWVHSIDTIQLLVTNSSLEINRLFYHYDVTCLAKTEKILRNGKVLSHIKCKSHYDYVYIKIKLYIYKTKMYYKSCTILKVASTITNRKLQVDTQKYIL